MDQSNPWRTENSKPIYDNPWISVREDAVIQPDGNPGIYGIVHFKNVAIGVVPLDQEGFIHLVGQYRYPLGIYSWEIPEGGCPEGEEPLAAAKRELKEETGLEAGEWRFLGRAHLSNSVSNEEALFYLATDLTHGVATPDATEKLAHKRVSFAQAIKMVMQDEITDALSKMAILQCAQLLNDGQLYGIH